MLDRSSIVGIYATLAEAEEAVKALKDHGFPVQNVSIVARPGEDEVSSFPGFVTSGDVARASATVGAWVGGLCGILAGSALIWVPGFGPLVVAGSVSAMMLGGVEGAIAGAAVSGALGWLVGLGISKEKIPRYEEAVRAGKFLLIAHASSEQITLAHKILTGSRAEHIDTHAPALT
jgi:hypothetical protein